jgi:formate--tetrahydrofolate ligase
MLTDIQIAQAAQLKPITEIAGRLSIPAEAVNQYGRYKAKVSHKLAETINPAKPDGKLILVTAISPTPAGEGKTTTTVGLADAMSKLGKNAVVCIREPSLGPVFGVKGGAAGGGYAQVVPMEDINLHFTGDLHAITTANNLLAAMVDNHIYQGNARGIDPRRVVWRRAMDMNDRQLRSIVDGLAGKSNGTPREDGFDITAASEVMAVFCLSRSIDELKQNLANIVVGYTYKGEVVTAGDINAQGAMATLLRDALDPNLVQTLEHTPAIIHGGPFANIAHGCNTVTATKLALRLGDFVITEAGFGADLGAEKFFDIKCRRFGLTPAAVVLVATIRALKYHGADAEKPLAIGIANLKRHYENITQTFGLPCVIAINKFPTDEDADIAFIRDSVREWGAEAALSDVFSKGGAGGIELAEATLRACEKPNSFRFSYDLNKTLKSKIEAVALNVYKADGVTFSPEAAATLRSLEKLGYGKLPVCIAKTQYSFSDNPKKLNAPEGFTVNVRQARLSAGAGFVVAITGDIMTMPGLPKVPAAEAVDVDAEGRIAGLF